MNPALLSPRSISRLSTRLALAAPILAALTACGASPSSEDATGATASASTVPCTAHNVVRGSSSSWLIVWPRVSDVYLGSFWYGAGAADRATIDSFWSTVANDQSFWARMNEYGIGGGSYGTSLVLPSPVFDNPSVPLTMTVADADHLVHALVDAGQVPRTDNNDLVVFYLPQTASIPGIGAYHSVYWDSNGKPFFYAVQNYHYDWIGEMTIETSHEIAEAATDPDGHSGYRDTTGSHGEIGDICAGNDYPWDGEGLQDIWSQETCQCIQATKPVIVDPCAKLKGTAKICCQKPYLPVCNEGLN